MNPLAFVSWILFCTGVQAAFQDFVIGPESHQTNNELELADESYFGEDAEEDTMVSFQDVEHDGIVDTGLLLKALMQQARRLGISLEDLANLHLAEEEEAMNHELGCSAGSEIYSYRERPTWRDVLFN
ncbi:uncharacterized protein Dana_GF11353 [Drosophila ananassae]|uniref:Uncharacterized protein n=1 Tax=Drosophila ananassae TaxID=7217 RepID=B3ME05_DROAN|nr:uncharacterized protein LOC6494217 [Drosophila ananassae]EDV37550.1 uncharacterized protein Dana_GF11353 [Drosophila ananassae]